MDGSVTALDTEQSVDLRRRLVVATGAVASLIVVYAVLYRWAVIAFTDESRSLVASAQVVVEALTTAGFGGDTALWQSSDVLAGLVIVMNLTGVALVFLGIPAFAVPLFRRAVDSEPPTESNLVDHVVICGYGRMDEILRDELESRDIPYLFVDPDPDTVERLVENDIDAIHGSPERVGVLERANVDRARAVVADIDDETNPTVILSSRRVGPDSRIVSVVANPEAAPHHRLAGADEVVVAKQDLGASLGRRAVQTPVELVRAAVGEIDAAEYLVEDGSPLAGQTLGELEVFDRLGITVIGGWFGARFVVSPSPDTTIEEDTLLLVSEAHPDLTELGTRKLPDHTGDGNRTIVCGYGDVGTAAAETIAAEGGDPVVVDSVDKPGVDVQGDITDAETVQRADITQARSVVLAINDDTAAVYATLLIDQIAPETEIIARANDPENVWKLYNAGADYVLSLPAVTGKTLAAAIIDRATILTPHDEFGFERVPAPGLVGETLAEADIRNETGCTVIGVERDGKLVTEVGPTLEIEAGDVLVAAGHTRALDRLREYAGGTTAVDEPSGRHLAHESSPGTDRQPESD